MSFLRKSPLLCLLLLAPALQSQTPATAPAASPAAAQTPPTPTTTLSVDVKVVTLPVTVRDKKGKIVTNLSKDDFVLEEDGKPQTIRYFNQETNLPLTVGLLVDTSESERDNLDKERAASRTFLDQMITRPADRAFVIHFDRQVELLQDLIVKGRNRDTAWFSMLDSEGPLRQANFECWSPRSFCTSAGARRFGSAPWSKWQLPAYGIWPPAIRRRKTHQFLPPS